jgi:hypothetical protein
MHALLHTHCFCARTAAHTRFPTHQTGDGTLGKRSWTRRWFVLNQRKCTLSYYTSNIDVSQVASRVASRRVASRVSMQKAY